MSQEYILDGDEEKVIDAFRKARKAGHADVTVSVKAGRIVKLWTTDKWDLDDTSRRELREPRGPNA